MATHFTILAWRIPMDRGAWRATAHRVAKSRTRLKQLSTHMPEGQSRVVATEEAAHKIENISFQEKVLSSQGPQVRPVYISSFTSLAGGHAISSTP